MRDDVLNKHKWAGLYAGSVLLTTLKPLKFLKYYVGTLISGAINYNR